MVDACARAAICGWLLFAIGCSPDNRPKTDSNSNWLSECEVTADCRGDGTCICGLCTRTCVNDRQCRIAGEGAFCVAPGEASRGEACAAVVSAADEKVCLAGCERDQDCEADSHCVAGACWRTPEEVVDRRDAGGSASDAGESDAGEDAGQLQGVRPPPVLRGIDAGIDLSAIDAAVGFEQPVERPVPETVFAGDAVEQALTGVWEAVPGASGFWGGDMRLEITAGTPGVTGTVAFMCDMCQPQGPPPPVTDPQAGYPPDLDPIRQDSLRTNILPRTPYRVLDARFADERLTFWFTNNDLWREWCALQTSYGVTLDGRMEHSCTPDPQPCFDFYGLPPDEIVAQELLCCADGSPCACDAAGCDVNFQSGVREVDLLVDGERMEGILLMGSETFRIVLQRVQS